jgi:hypothetical protein
MKDRASNPNYVLSNGAIRYGVYDETEELVEYLYIKKEDDPSEEGDTLNKANILSDPTVTALQAEFGFTFTGEPTPDKAFAALKTIHYPAEIDSATWTNSIAATTQLQKSLPHGLGKVPSRVRLHHVGVAGNYGVIIDITYNGSTYDFSISGSFTNGSTVFRPWQGKKGTYVLDTDGTYYYGSLGVYIRLNDITFTSTNIVFTFYNTSGSAKSLEGKWTAEVYK